MSYVDIVVGPGEATTKASPTGVLMGLEFPTRFHSHPNKQKRIKNAGAAASVLLVIIILLHTMVTFPLDPEFQYPLICMRRDLIKKCSKQ